MKKLTRIILYALFFFVILFPELIRKPGLPAIRFEDVLLSLIIFHLFVAVSEKKSFFRASKITHLILFIGYFSLFSLGVQELGLSMKITINDIMIFPMLFKYLMFYQFAKYFIVNEDEFSGIFTVITLCGLFAALIAIFQYQAWISINQWFTPMYNVRPLLLRALQQKLLFRRAVGTHGDPRHFGYILVFISCFLLNIIIHKKNISKKIMYISLQMIIILAIIATVSRTVIIALIIVLLFSIFNYVKIRGKLLKFLPISIIIIGLSLTYTISRMNVEEQIESRLLDTETRSYQHSFHARVRDFIKPLNRAFKNPSLIILGMGSAKEYMRTDSHNEYGWLFQRYGIVGLILYIMIIYYGLKFSLIKYRNAQDINYQILYLAIASVMVNWAIFCMAENILKQIQLMPLNMMALGFIGELEDNSKNNVIE